MNNIFTGRRRRPSLVSEDTAMKRLEATAAEFQYHAAVTNKFGGIGAYMFLRFSRMFVQMLEAYNPPCSAHRIRKPLSFALTQNKEVYVGKRIAPDCLEQGQRISLLTLTPFRFLMMFYESQTLVLTIHGEGFVASVEWTSHRPQSLFFFATAYNENPDLKKHLLRYAFISKSTRRGTFRVTRGSQNVDSVRSGRRPLDSRIAMLW